MQFVAIQSQYAIPVDKCCVRIEYVCLNSVFEQRQATAVSVLCLCLLGEGSTLAQLLQMNV